MQRLAAGAAFDREFDGRVMNFEVGGALTVEVGELRHELAQFMRAQTRADDRAMQVRIEFREPRASLEIGELRFRRRAAGIGALRRTDGRIDARAGETKGRSVHEDLYPDVTADRG